MKAQMSTTITLQKGIAGFNMSLGVLFYDPGFLGVDERFRKKRPRSNSTVNSVFS